MKDKNDVELVAAFKNGDQFAFDKLLFKYKDKIFTICYRFLGDYEDAKDCSQEVFIKVYYSIKDFRQDAAFL